VPKEVKREAPASRFSCGVVVVVVIDDDGSAGVCAGGCDTH
jgi:hypothetical protein